VTLTPSLAIDGGYWLAGILTVVAAAVVTVVILVSSKSDDRGS
jgi:hypothetical protein